MKINVLANFPLSEPGFLVHLLTKDKSLEILLKKTNSNLSIKDFQKSLQTICNIIALISMGIILWGGHFLQTIIMEICICILMIKLAVLHIRTTWVKMQQKFEQELHMFIDVLRLTLKAGMNFHQAFAHVIHHLNLTLTKSLKNTKEMIELGKYEEVALKESMTYIDIQPYSRLISAILQGNKLGIPLSKTLSIESTMIQTRERQKMQEIARTASIKISIPLVFFIFPSLLIIYIGPGILRMMQ